MNHKQWRSQKFYKEGPKIKQQKIFLKRGKKLLQVRFEQVSTDSSKMFKPTLKTLNH